MHDELIGRAQLWSNALIDCKQALDLSNRFTEAAAASPVIAEQSNFEAFYQAETGRPYDRLHAYSGDLDVFERFRPALPTPSECLLGAYHLQKIAIVYLAQLWSSGNAAPGIVTMNKGDAGTELRKRLLELAFPDESDRVAFGETMKQVLRLRDKQIGHADGSEFAVRHAAQSVASTIEPVPFGLQQALVQVLPLLIQAVQALLADLLHAKVQQESRGPTK